MLLLTHDSNLTMHEVHLHLYVILLGQNNSTSISMLKMSSGNSINTAY